MSAISQNTKQTGDVNENLVYVSTTATSNNVNINPNLVYVSTTATSNNVNINPNLNSSAAQGAVAYVPTIGATYSYSYSYPSITIEDIMRKIEKIEKMLAIIELDKELDELNKKFPAIEEAYNRYKFLVELHKNISDKEDNE